MRSAALWVLLVASPALAEERAPSRAGDCIIRIGPNDRVAKEGTVEVIDGENLDTAIAIHGNVVVRRGGKVAKAVALGGNVTVEGGAVVTEAAVAVGGDVTLAKGARVEKDAMALGGRVRQAAGASVSGAVLSLSLQLGQDLESKILAELRAEGAACRVDRER